MTRKFAPGLAPDQALSKSQQTSVSIIAVGEPSEWTRQGNLLPTDGMAFVSYHEVSEAVLALYDPQVIVSPALAPSFDCIELALLLQTIGYTGAYRAVAKDIPNPDLIEREVAQICPLIDFRIVNTH